jgi:hypothetical protein
MAPSGGIPRISGRDYQDLLKPSGVATLERLVIESLDFSGPYKAGRRHLDDGLE